MTKEETKQLFSRIIMSYENFTVTSEKVDYWNSILSDLPHKLAINNLDDYVRKNKFPPTMADIRNGYKKEEYYWNDMTEEQRIAFNS